MHAGLGRQVGGGRCDGLYAGLLVVGNDRHRVAQLLLRDGPAACRSRFHLAINASALRPSSQQSRDRAVPASVSHFVRFHLFLVERILHTVPLGEVGETHACRLRGSMLASVAGQKPRCPQFVGIAKFLRLPACQRHQPCLGLGSDRRLSTGARAIIQRSQRAFGHGALDAALDRLMMQPECPADRKKRGVFSIGQQYPRPLHPARRFSARLRYRSQLRRISFSKRQLKSPAATLP